MAKTKVTDWRIIGVSGNTVDGRKIEAAELIEMAEQYDPEIYGARVNLEHISFIFPKVDGAYGDVLELKAEPWHKDPLKTALLARIEVREALQDIWDDGEKVYTSMEIMSPFADTGKAYLVGLAVTDTPASLGTTANFSAGLAAANGAKFTDYQKLEKQDAEMSQDKAVNEKDKPLTEAAAEGIFSRLLGKFRTEESPAVAAVENQPQEPAEQGEKQDYAAEIGKLKEEYTAAAELVGGLVEKLGAQEKQILNLKTELAALQDRFEKEPYTGARAEHQGDNQAAEAATW